MEGLHKPTEHLLSTKGYPIQVIARPRDDVIIDNTGEESTPLGHLQFEQPLPITTTVYGLYKGESHASFAVLDFEHIPGAREDVDEVITPKELFMRVGGALDIVGRAKRISANVFDLAVAHGVVHRMRLLEGDDGEDNVVIYMPELGTDPEESFKPRLIQASEGYTDTAAIMDVGRAVSEVVNNLLFLFGTAPKQEVLEISLPNRAGQDTPRQLAEVAAGNAYLPQHAKFPSFEDFGGLDTEIERLREVIRDIQTPPEVLEHYGVERPHGILLVGPGGVGKTELPKALAKELRADFRDIKVSEIMSTWVGESGRNLRRTFDRAAAFDGPVILFFDEMDGLFAQGAGGNSGAARSLIAEYKKLLSSIDDYPNVWVIGAANSLENFDPALLRPGRFDVHIQIPKPDEAGRAAIFGKYLLAREVHYSLPQLHNTSADVIDVHELALISENLTGADIKQILQSLLRSKMHRELELGASPPKLTHSQLAAAVYRFKRSRVNES